MFWKELFTSFVLEMEIMTGFVGHGALLQLSYPGPRAEKSASLRR